MTDAGIIKALECFAIDKDFDCSQCVGCAFETKGLCCENCSDGIAKASLDLINRQKAEIESLNELINQSTKSTLEVLTKVQNEKDAFAIQCYIEGVNDFAEKVKTNKNVLFNYVYSEKGFDEQIDNLAEEMAGDTE